MNQNIYFLKTGKSQGVFNSYVSFVIENKGEVKTEKDQIFKSAYRIYQDFYDNQNRNIRVHNTVARYSVGADPDQYVISCDFMQDFEVLFKVPSLVEVLNRLAPVIKRYPPEEIPVSAIDLYEEFMEKVIAVL